MRSIGLVNSKGGVSKTTSTINLGAELAALGKRVLLVDADPQGCLTTALGIAADASPALGDVLLATRPPIAAADALVEAHGMTVLPAGLELARAELALVAKPAADERLARALQPLARRFDFCLVDSAPSLGILTLNVIRAVGEVIIPCSVEVMALRRLVATLDTIEELRQFHEVRVLGILPAMFDERLLHAREVLVEMHSALKPHRIYDPIPRSVRVAESAAAGPLRSYEPTSPASAAYARLAAEVVNG